MTTAPTAAVLFTGNRDSWGPGERALFEHHGREGDTSFDPALGRRSLSGVTVLGVANRASVQGLTFFQRGENGSPLTYRVRFDDGHETTVFEDELLVQDGAHVR